MEEASAAAVPPRHLPPEGAGPRSRRPGQLPSAIGQRRIAFKFSAACLGWPPRRARVEEVVGRSVRWRPRPGVWQGGSRVEAAAQPGPLPASLG